MSRSQSLAWVGRDEKVYAAGSKIPHFKEVSQALEIIEDSIREVQAGKVPDEVIADTKGC